ncbi:MAG: DUF2232 domain-containing protein, partial [Alphaproteobacteria bacterium]|nr:DUF2232 domain-containing protein [Alphaproteobacteria bacterium]
PLFMAGLSLGGSAALVAAGAGVTAIAVAGGPMLSLAYFVVNAAAPILICRTANLSREFTGPDGKTRIEYYPAGLMFAWLSGLGTVIMLLLALYVHRFEGGMEVWIPRILEVERLSQAILQAQMQTGSTQVDMAGLQQRLVLFALPGLALFWTLICIGNGALAQRLLVRLGRNIRPSPELLNMSLPGFMLWPLAAGLILAFVPGDIGLSGLVVAVLAAIPYFFLGLATVHVISHRLPGRKFALAGIYILLMALGWPFLLIVGLGIIEQFANLRLSYAVAKP